MTDNLQKLWLHVDTIRNSGCADDELHKILWDYFPLLDSHIKKLEREKEELLALVKSTATGAVAASERNKQAMTKGLEVIGLAQSMILGGEEHSHKSQTMFEEAVGSLHTALRFMSEKPQKTSGSLAAEIPKGWAGTPEMAEEYVRTIVPVQNVEINSDGSVGAASGRRSGCCGAEIDPVDMGLSYTHLCRKCMGTVCNRCGFEARLGHSDNCPTSTARG